MPGCAGSGGTGGDDGGGGERRRRCHAVIRLSIGQLVARLLANMEVRIPGEIVDVISLWLLQ